MSGHLKAAAKDPRTVTWSAAWLSLPVTFAILEGHAWATGNYEETLTARMREMFRTNTKVGRTVWLATIGLTGGLLAGHIMGKEETIFP